MKNLILLLALAVTFASGQERSDFQTVKAFESQTKNVSTAIDEVQTVQECADVSLAIDRIAEEFEPFVVAERKVGVLVQVRAMNKRLA